MGRFLHKVLILALVVLISQNGIAVAAKYAHPLVWEAANYLPYITKIIKRDLGGWGFKDEAELPAGVRNPYQVFMVDTHSIGSSRKQSRPFAEYIMDEHIWEIPLCDEEGKINLSCFALYSESKGGRIVALGRALPSDLATLSSNRKELSKVLVNQGISSDAETKHLRIPELYADLIYIKDKGKEYLMPLSSGRSIPGLKNMVAYDAAEVAVKLAGMLSSESTSRGYAILFGLKAPLRTTSLDLIYSHKASPIVFDFGLPQQDRSQVVYSNYALVAFGCVLIAGILHLLARRRLAH